MGRPKKSPDAARNGRIHARVRIEYLEWVKVVAVTAGDDDIISLIERLVANEAKRLKLPKSPGR